jgi:hypothetical protein
MTKSIGTSCVICFILALLTVLSIVPVFLLFFACDFSPCCLAWGFGRFLMGPTGLRKPAVVVLLGPIFILLAYILAFLSCYRRRDLLDRSVMAEQRAGYSRTGSHTSNPPLPVAGSKFSP